MKNKFDIIIVGAGPGGLKCAEELKNSNLSVLLIEKNKVIGHKVCAGGLTQLSANFNFPESKIKNCRNVIFSLNGKRQKIDFIRPIRTIDRYDLGQYLLVKIKDSENITILRETTVSEVKENKVITNKGDFYYKYLVGADGSSSVVRKHLGLKSNIMIGLRCKVSQITDELVSYFMPQLLGTGYCWIFPHRDYTNVGIYFNPKHLSSRKAKELLENFLKKNNFVCSSHSLEGAPLNSLYKGCIFQNIFLIGDAAGLVSSITGEGIPQALISGREVGRKIFNPDYKMPGLKKILGIKRRQETVEKISNFFPFLQYSFIKIFIKLAKKDWFQLYFFE